MQNRRSSFEFEDLLACGRGEMFAAGPQLPLPPMLMFERISEISDQGGEHGRGLARAELEVKPDLWFFPCHFKGEFSGVVVPTVKKLVYGIDIKRVMRSKLVLGIADGWMSADGSIIYRAFDLKVGLVRDIAAHAPAAS